LFHGICSISFFSLLLSSSNITFIDYISINFINFRDLDACDSSDSHVRHCAVVFDYARGELRGQSSPSSASPFHLISIAQVSELPVLILQGTG
jgi:hypothetical protein